MTARYQVLRAAILLWLTAVICGGFLMDIPRIDILEHTARNLYFHVPMWFTMMAATGVSAYQSVQFLRTGNLDRDIRATESARMAVMFGVLGLITGIVWAKVTWYRGSDVWWNFDPRQTMAATQLLIYGAYFVLRSGMDEPERRGRVAAVYNIFAFSAVPFLLYVLPRQFESLHPGAGDNPAFSDITDPRMRLVFYPAVAGFIALFWLLYHQQVRLRRIKNRLEEVDV